MAAEIGPGGAVDAGVDGLQVRGVLQEGEVDWVEVEDDGGGAVNSVVAAAGSQVNMGSLLAPSK